jgi:DNA mismatch endonuclease, patch repair protein
MTIARVLTVRRYTARSVYSRTGSACGGDDDWLRKACYACLMFIWDEWPQFFVGRLRVVYEQTGDLLYTPRPRLGCGARRRAYIDSDLYVNYRPKPASKISRNMAAIRSTGNAVETALRRALHSRGLRFRKYRADLPGRPDIVFPRSRVAVFVDGDYWHCRVLVEQGPEALEATLRTPSRDYWRDKFHRRVERDRQVTAALQGQGWLVLRYWESDVKKSIDLTAEKISRVVRSRR